MDGGLGGEFDCGAFHAVAVDYDGTLAHADVPAPEALSALTELRARGVKTVLVTGRRLSELRRVFADVDERFDLVVAENGAVVSHAGVDRTVAAPVPDELAAALDRAQVHFARGQVLLACHDSDETAVLAEVRRLGLECELLRNRSALMVLPAGVSKGSGLFEGLGEIGISHHNTVAVGDAENDHSLLDVAELGVAVADAVDALKAHADVVLDQPDGQGVAAFLRGPVMAGRQRIHPRRWQIHLGRTDDGTPVTIPASQVNVLVAGSPRRGKSYLAGLLAEQLIGMRYSLLVFDPEGDHANLGRLRGVMVVGGSSRLPSPDELVRLISHRFASVVVDLSGVSAHERLDYLRVAPAVIEAHRNRTGLPHWVVFDEAHDPLGRTGAPHAFLEPSATGYCMVTHRPEDLCPEALLGVDVVIAVPGGPDIEPALRLIAAAGGMPRAAARRLLEEASPGHAVLVDRTRPGTSLVFAVAKRDTAHLRHWHKYSTGRLEWERRFHFRADWDTPTGRAAGSVGELERELLVCSEAVISHHSRHGDLSRWIAEVIGDPPLAAQVSAIEARLRAGETSTAEARRSLGDAIHHRYPG